MNIRRWLSLGVKLCISVLLIWVLLQNVELGLVLEQMKGMDIGHLSIAGAFSLCQVPLVALRWRSILSALGSDLPHSKAIRVTFIGQFFNQVLPTTFGGDAVRVWLIHRTGTPLGLAVNTVILDRVAALAVVVLFVTLFLPGLNEIVDDQAIFWPIAISVLICALGMILLLAGANVVQNLLGRIRFLRGVLDFVHGYRNLFLSNAAGPVLIFAALILLSTILLVHQLALGMGVDAQLWQYALVVPVVILAMALPISFAGWGIREGAMVLMMGFIGVASAEALAISIIFGLLIMATGVIGGVFWLLDFSKRKSHDPAADRVGADN